MEAVSFPKKKTNTKCLLIRAMGQGVLISREGYPVKTMKKAAKRF